MNINSGVMKESNLQLIVSFLRSRKQLSRKAIAKSSGLTPATVTNLVKELLDQGFVMETGHGKSHGGPRPIMLELNPRWGYVIGISLTVTDIICVLSDFQANVIARSTTAIDISRGPAAIVSQIANEFEELVGAANVPRASVRGIGIVSAGPLSRDEGLMLAPPNFPGWENTPIRDLVQQQTNLPVWIDKETQAAAFGEAWFGDATESKTLFVCNILKVGIGGGILIDSKSYRGNHDNAGNIGHTKVDLNGTQCTCGEFGCLETVADGRAAVLAVRKQYRLDPKSFGQDKPAEADIDFSFVVRSAQQGQPACRKAVTDCARYAGMALSNVIRTLAPDTIVLCGEFPDQSPLFVSECIKSANLRHDQALEPVRIYHSQIGPDITALGGVALVLDNLGPSIA